METSSDPEDATRNLNVIPDHIHPADKNFIKHAPKEENPKSVEVLVDETVDENDNADLNYKKKATIVAVAGTAPSTVVTAGSAPPTI